MCAENNDGSVALPNALEGHEFVTDCTSLKKEESSFCESL